MRTSSGRSCYFLALILGERALENHALQTQLLDRSRLCCRRTLHNTSAPPPPRIQQFLKAPSA